MSGRCWSSCFDGQARIYRLQRARVDGVRQFFGLTSRHDDRHNLPSCCPCRRKAPCVQGNCTQPPPLHLLLSVSAGGLPGGFPMLPMRQNQCLIIVDAAFLIARDQVWLDGLYLRLMLPPQSSAFVVSVWPETVVPVERHKLWMTDITIQGNSWPHSLHELQLTWGVQVYDIDLLAQGACCV